MPDQVKQLEAQTIAETLSETLTPNSTKVVFNGWIFNFSRPVPNVEKVAVDTLLELPHAR
jgi:hypothetical protein